MRTAPGMRPLAAIGLGVTVMLLTSCAPLLAANPRYATDSGAHPQGQPPTTSTVAGPPPIAAPKNDLPDWRDCTAQTFSTASVAPLPGVKLECTTYQADLD